MANDRVATVVSARVSAALRAMLYTIAEELGITVSELVRDLLEEALVARYAEEPEKE